MIPLWGPTDLSTRPSRHTIWKRWPTEANDVVHWTTLQATNTCQLNLLCKQLSSTYTNQIFVPQRWMRPPLWPTSFLTVNTISLSHNCLACYLSSRPISLVNSSSMNDRINISKAPFSTISSAALSPANPIHLFRLLSYSTKGFHTSRGSITCTYKFAYKLSMRLLEIKKFKVLFHTARNRRSLTRTGAHIGPGKWGVRVGHIGPGKWGVRVSPLWES